MALLTQQSPLARVPALRILVPQMLGIVMATMTQCSIIVPAAIMVVGIFLYIALKYAVPHTPVWSLRVRWMWILPLSLMCMALGWINSIASRPPTIDTQVVNGTIAQVRIDDIEFKDRSMSIYGTLTSARRDSMQLLDREHKVLLTTRDCDYSMQPGDVVMLRCKLGEITNMGNPDGFDYVQFMQDRGIRYRQHVALDSIMVAGQAPTLLTRCNKLRREIEREVFGSRLSAEAQDFVVATILGNGKFISRETRNTFAAAGVSHILALSGMHVGIITLLIWFVLLPLDYLHMRRLRLGLTIVILAGYAIFTGLSASVVRATVMSVIVLVGMITHRKSISLNALAIAGIILLLYSPAMLFNPGFQLSFITVASLLIFYDDRARNSNSNKVVNYLSGIVVTSIVAMLSTVILSAWYFNTVSLISFVTNVLILPLFPFIMAMNAIFVMLCSVGIEIPWLTAMVDAAYTCIASVTRFMGDAVPGHISNLYVTGTEVASYYIALVMVLIWWKLKHIKWLMGAGIVVAAMIVHNGYVAMTTPTQGFYIVNNYSQAQIFSFNAGKGKLWTPYSETDGTADVELFRQRNSKFLAHYHISNIEVETGKMRDVINGKRIAIVGNGRWKRMQVPKERIKADIVVITKRFHGKMEKLSQIYDAKLYVISGEVYEDRVYSLERQCQSLGLPYHTIRTQGAYVAI
ncbi:MAG: ComEC/Rec2 family competence protein [Bacteroidales bacterium]|nr:ComEC/Rec2 family competence protein [Candidatus Sodaliphilus fimicaballi]